LGGKAWPQVKASKQAGFGARLIKSACEYDLEGEARIDLRIGEVDLRNHFPDSIFPESIKETGVQFSAALKGARILIVEDESESGPPR
jgi:hypothetical protein